MKNKTHKKPAPRRCTVCNSLEHRASFHGTREERAAAIQGTLEPSPVVAMRTVIDPNYALWLVSEGSVGHALANATRATQTTKTVTGNAALIALSELEERSRKLPPELIAELREAKHKRDEAMASYNEIADKLTTKLGYEK